MIDERESAGKVLPSADLKSYSEAVAIGQLVEMMMQNQQSIGELTADVRNIVARVNDHGNRLDKINDKIDRINYTVIFISVLLLISAALGGFFLDAFWNDIREIFALVSTR